jgi:modulator of FtsH protease
MQDIATPSVPYGATAVAVRNRTLRNTYALLALSMVPTVLGAWIGVQSGAARWMSVSPGMSMLLFFGGAFGLMYMVQRNSDRAAGVAWLMAFTFFMGLMLSRLLAMIMGLSNGGTLIMAAFGGTGAVFASMAGLSTVVKRDLSGLGKFLFVGAVILMIASVAAVFLQVPALTLTILVLALAIFSAYLLYDLNRIVTGGETNYITATLAVYLDVYNIFTSLLSLLGIFGGERD